MNLISAPRYVIIAMITSLLLFGCGSDSKQTKQTESVDSLQIDATLQEQESVEQPNEPKSFVTKPKARFTFAEAHGITPDTYDTPYSYVMLNVEASSTVIGSRVVAMVSGSAQPMDKEEQQRLGFPADALDAFTSFWGGLSTMGYVIYDVEKGLRVQLVYADESTELPLDFYAVESFEISYQDIEAYSSDEAPNPLSLDEAKTLVANASDAYWYIKSGGNGEQVSRFDYGRTLGTDLDNLDKVRSYLAPYFTGEAISILASSLFVIEGKLGQREADGGSLLQWKQAKIALKEDETNKKTYKFAVPLGDSGKSEPIEVVLGYERGQGWRVHEPLPF
ncbi:MAG: hypothetical protein JJT94_16540 [Bernardetiaceae bacterium]|nr:hypothetical protein [Bernardetiaceae bacterium]